MVSFRDGLALAAVGWWLSPIITFLLNKLLSCIYDASKELLQIRSGTMPRLKFTLDQVLEQSMLMELSEREPPDNTKVKDSDTLLRDLKNALYEAEDIFDLIDYYRIEKEVGDDSKTSWLQWCWQRIYDSTRVKQTLCWLWQWLRAAGGRLAPLLQRVHQWLCSLWHWVRNTGEKSAPLLQLAWQGLCWLWRCVPRSEERLPIASTASASLVQRISLWCRSFDFKNFCSCIFNWLSKAIEGARYYRDWSFDQFGFTSYQQGVGMESNCTIMGPLYIKLKKNMAKVEHLIDESQKIISLKQNLQETIALPNQLRRNESGTSISNDTSGERQGLGLHSNTANSRATVTTSTPPSVVIGLDKDCDKVVAMLHEREEDGQPDTNSAQCYSVIGIHGIAGSGKSTLVQLVCAREKKDRQDKKDGHFDIVIWVHVSQDFSVDTIFKEMFEAATGTPCPHFNNLDTLQSNLEKKLHEKRFLLVLDDVWYSNRVGGDMTQYAKLQKIFLPLNVGKAGSKVLVTSRKENALLALGAAKRRCIPISFLDDDAFLNLFMHYALHSPPIDDLVRMELEDIGKEIAKKLKGLPLAAKVVGGQLCIRQNVEFWREVRDGNLWDETMGALWGSYQLLDEEVRRCFAYCSVFPRRRGLERDELVKLWAAQGFAGRGKEGEGMEDVCRNYFDELVSASFLQLRAKEYAKQKEDYYVVHDLLYDLAERVTGSDCFRINNLQSPEVEVPSDVRHVFLQIYDAPLITEKICKLENLRTLIIDEAQYVEEKVLKSMFERLRKLRVLIMTGYSTSFSLVDQFSVPASIGQLRHLRYLAFRGKCVFEETGLVLPGTLTKLYHMQVLNFSCVEELVFSPWEGIFGLIKLGHLIGPDNLKIPNIGRLASLRTLRYFAATKEQGYELKQLGNLNKLSGELCITCLENVESQQEALEAKLADKEGLRELALWWSYGLASPEVQTEVLEGLCPPMGLESLSIDGYKSLRYPSWMVSRHNGGPKYLKCLDFRGWVAEPGPELRGFCTHLRTLTIWHCSWQALPNCMEHMASLQMLRICDCMNIQSLPMLPQSLEVFALCSCNEVLMSSCRTVGNPYWQKIQHIRYATIEGPGSFYMLKMGVVQNQNGANWGSDSSSSEETSAVKRKFKWRMKRKSVRVTRLSRHH